MDLLIFNNNLTRECFFMCQPFNKSHRYFFEKIKDFLGSSPL